MPSLSLARCQCKGLGALMLDRLYSKDAEIGAQSQVGQTLASADEIPTHGIEA
jgi:hypothetical protein